MKVMEGHWPSWQPLPGATAVTIGVMDGVHLGHRALLAALDPERVRTVLTFEPHPVEVLRPGTVPRLITTIEERLSLFTAVGIEQTAVLDLAEVRHMAAEEFVESVLVKKLDVAQVVVGDDFRFGHDRQGDVPLLRRLGGEHGFEVTELPLVAHRGETVSSSRIRALIENGEVAAAAELLGSWYSLSNLVEEGDRRGRALGFPTANLRPPARKVIPAMGVYACFALVGGRRHPAAVSVGVRPTFGGGDLLVEAHLLDFEGDLYGEEVSVEFVERLRPELEFTTVEELVVRMGQDVAESRAILDSVVAI